MRHKRISTWQTRFAGAGPEEILRFFRRKFGKKTILLSSLSPEDQILTDMMAGIWKPPRIAILDTGRFFQETYDLMQTSMSRWGIRYEVHFPEARLVERLEQTQGPNAMYESVDSRKACCHARKVLPLRRALRGNRVWITGQRRGQSSTRTGLDKVEWDSVNRLIKLNPLADWTTEDVWRRIRERNIPYNPLHNRSFPSIGCAPCTRPVGEGEDPRSGRWWWERPESRECGLHPRQPERRNYPL